MIYHVIRCPHCGVKFLLWQHRYVWECGRCRRKIVLGPRFGEMLAANGLRPGVGAEIDSATGPFLGYRSTHKG
jgi:hypothetical protein